MVRARRKKEARGSILLSYHSSLVVIKVVLVSCAIIKVVLVSCYMLLRLVSVWSETPVCVCVLRFFYSFHSIVKAHPAPVAAVIQSKP